MHVVYVASEVVPFAKSGGLGDVAAGLPRALEQLGHTVTVFVPCYRRAWSAGQELADTGVSLSIDVGADVVEGRVRESRLPGSGVRVFLIDQPRYFDRNGLYGTDGSDYPDNCARFTFFNRAVLETVEALDLGPDIVHCNDWQAGLIPVYLKTLYRRIAEHRGLGTLFTIHNLAYLGLFRQWDMALTGLDWRLFNWRQLEFHGSLSFMKAGLVFGDMLSTVSPTYAKEIQTPRYGSGLDGLLRHRQGDLRGIVNGIDTEVWSPKNGVMLAEPYDAATVVSGKARCKAWLQRQAGLADRPDVPLFAQVGRLAAQKGWDLLAKVIDRLLARDVQMVVLGEGEWHYRVLIEDLARRYAGKFWAYLGFSDELAHQIEAGADIFLMPSLFEPCGLSQLYSLAHGTVPVARATGGLADTVVDAYPETVDSGRANGFVFTEANPEALWQAIERALALWPDQESWLTLVRTGMSADWSWRHSAREYEALYQEIQRRVKSRTTRADSGETGGRPPAKVVTG
jgi:starch synthase